MKFQELKENLGVSHPKKEENRLKKGGVNYSFFISKTKNRLSLLSNSSVKTTIFILFVLHLLL